ncbi:MAG: DUF1987 domain-containing protein [Pseudomonadota bacterium]
MQDLHIAASGTSPEVDFRFSSHRLALIGESYPENAAAFYGPVIEALREYLAQANGQRIEVHVELRYFNSSSTKVLFNIFDLLNSATGSNEVVLHWYHDEEDDTILEFGNDLHEDFPSINYIPMAIVA